MQSDGNLETLKNDEIAPTCDFWLARCKVFMYAFYKKVLPDIAVGKTPTVKNNQT
jgi:hypothetical protein